MRRTYKNPTASGATIAACASKPRSRSCCATTCRAAVSAVPRAGLDLVGIAVHGPRNVVDKTIKGARLHR